MRIYLDYAASTPVAVDVLKTMKPYFSEKYGNSGSLHSFGQEAMAAVDMSREIVAKAAGVDFREVIFTSSATEANNLVLRGVIRALGPKRQLSSKRRKFNGPAYRIIVSAIEHECILETVKDLEKEEAEVIYLPVDKNGLVDLKKLKNSLNERTILVSVMYVNNVIGTVEPVKEIAGIIKNYKADRIKSDWPYPLFHTDAVQAFQYFDCGLASIGADFMTLSSHKMYGPKGVGALAASPTGIKLVKPVITGGGQEFGLRSGTHNVPAIVGFAKAAAIAVADRNKEVRRLAELKNYFCKKLKKIIPSSVFNSPAASAPHIINVYFPGHSAQDLIMKFDLAGIAVSAGSACSVRAARFSHVLEAIGLPPERILGSVRFSFGKPTGREEIDEVLNRIKIIFKKHE